MAASARGIILLLIPLWQGSPVAAEIIDEVVAVVGQGVITASEVEEQLRLEALFNRDPVDLSKVKRRDALARLIDRRLLEREITAKNFPPATVDDVAKELAALERRTTRNGAAFEQQLESYGLTTKDVEQFLVRQANFERFVDFRFKTGMQVSPEAVRAYYEESFVPEVRRLQAEAPPLEEVYDKIAAAVMNERADSMLVVWLKETHARTRVVIMEIPPSLSDNKDRL